MPGRALPCSGEVSAKDDRQILPLVVSYPGTGDGLLGVVTEGSPAPIFTGGPECPESVDGMRRRLRPADGKLLGRGGHRFSLRWCSRNEERGSGRRWGECSGRIRQSYPQQGGFAAGRGPPLTALLLRDCGLPELGCRRDVLRGTRAVRRNLKAGPA